MQYILGVDGLETRNIGLASYLWTIGIKPIKARKRIESFLTFTYAPDDRILPEVENYIKYRARVEPREFDFARACLKRMIDQAKTNENSPLTVSIDEEIDDMWKTPHLPVPQGLGNNLDV